MTIEHDTLLRQWEMLRLIPRYPRVINAKMVTEFLQSEGYFVSKRTVERDLMELSSKFPLYVNESKKPYDWSWQKDAPSFDLPSLDFNESLMLVMAEKHLGQLLPVNTTEVLKPYFNAARAKLEVLAKSNKGWLDKVRTVLPQQPLISPQISREVQKSISEALLEDRQTLIQYKRRGSTEAQEMRIHPLGMVQRGGVIYLYVRIFDYSDTRILAMHRIQSAEKLQDSTVYPDNFDLDNDIEIGRFAFGNGEKIELKLLISQEAAEHLDESPLSVDQKIDSSENELLTLTAKVPNTPQLKWWILSMGENVTVLAPSELRKSIIQTLNTIQTAYSK